MIILVLNFIGLLLIFKWFKNQIKDFKALKSSYFTLNRFQSILIALSIILIPIIAVNFTSIEEINHISTENIKNNKWFYAIIVSFFISFVWFLYLYKLDVFDKEKKRYLLLVIVISSIVTLFTEIPYNFIHSLGFRNVANPVGSFLYSVFGIGLIEETVKLIPLLIMLRFTKVIDEPYDYILYASCAALGFSFVENTMYLNNFGIEIINARALYATVAHMTFSSMIAYGLFLIKFKKTKYTPVLIFIFFFLLAIFSHGFYDFWVMNKAVVKFKGLTTLFFLTTVHIWFTMKNNTLNNSNYYKHNTYIKNDYIKIYLIISLLSIFMFSYFYVSVVWNSKEANMFLMRSSITYGYIIFYLIATLSKFNLIKGFTFPFKWNNSRFIIPKKKDTK